MILTKDYIVGLVDGEGSFTVQVRHPIKSTKVKRRARIEPRFFLKLVEKDRAILDKLKEYFGCGQVYYQKDRRPNHQNCCRYEVSNRKNLDQIILPFFRKNKLKLISKKKDFDLLCKIMKAIREGEHLTDQGLSRLFKIKQQMH